MKQSLLAKFKERESEIDSKSDSEKNKGKKTIDEEHNATIRVTKIQSKDIEELEEGEHLFHSQMWVKGTPLNFIVDTWIQKKLISSDVIKRLKFPTMPHHKPYTIGWLSQGHDIRVSQQYHLPYKINPFNDEVLYDISPLEVCDVLLGPPYM